MIKMQSHCKYLRADPRCAVPRKANALAHHALFAAAIHKAKSINTEHVQAGKAPKKRAVSSFDQAARLWRWACS